MSGMETVLTDTVKGSMRILSKSAVIENDINNMIAAAKQDLSVSGVKKIDETDALIIRAITLFVKSEMTAPESEPPVRLWRFLAEPLLSNR